MTKKKIKLKQWDAAAHLKSHEDMALYLDACIDEDAGDGSLIRVALGDIARAHGMSLWKLSEIRLRL